MQYPLSTRKHRVLIYVTCYNVLDGVTLTLRKIEQEILAQGHSVCILSTNSGNSQNTHMHMEEDDQNYQFNSYRHLPNRHPNRTVIFLDNSIPIPFLHDPNNPEDSYHLGFSLSNAVRKKLDDFGPTIVHVTVPDVTCMHLIQYARAQQLPLMGTYHSNIPDYFTHYPGIGWLKHIVAGYERHQYNFLQALFVPTPFIRRHLTVEEHYRFDKITDLKVWGRGVDLERFHPSHRSETFRKRYGFATDDVVVAWVGRLVPEKRPDIFAYVVRRLAAEGIPFKALVVGAGPCEGEMKSLPNTTFAGWVTGDELAVAYASSDVFLFPSAVETFGNVTLEAAASGVPLVVDSGCSGHLVQHGVNGFACKDGDLESYYNGTLSLVLDDWRRKSMSKEGRQFSLRFEKRTVCRRMIDNYANVTEEFYGLYRGNHANRDREYENKPDSFVGGSYVRPTSLMLVEYVFIALFRIAYRIAEILSSVRRYINIASKNRATRKNKQTKTTGQHSKVAAAEVSSTSNNIVIVSKEIDSNSSTDVSASVTVTVNSVSEIAEPIDESLSYDVQQNYQQQEPNEIGGIGQNTRMMTMTTDDDDDDDDDEDTNYSTDSSIASCVDDNSSSSCSSFSTTTTTSNRNRRYVDRFWKSELPISHNLAILLIKSVRAQGRIECGLRKSYARAMSASPINDVLDRVLVVSKEQQQHRKRKCSEELTPDDFNGTSMLALQLKESLLPVRSFCDSTTSRCSSDSSLAEDIDTTLIVSPTTSTSTARTTFTEQQGLNSRRVKSSSNFADLI